MVSHVLFYHIEVPEALADIDVNRCDTDASHSGNF
jgi:hypothetical protein